MGSGAKNWEIGGDWDMHQLEELIRGKRVVFVTTKNIDYIRNVQEIRFLEDYAGKLKLIYSGMVEAVYPGRAVRRCVLWFFAAARCTIFYEIQKSENRH